MREARQPSGKRLLVVEDDAMVATTIADILEDAGYEVIGPVRNVAEALNAVEVDGPDAAILDFTLNRANTLALAEVLAKRGLPVLFVTGNVAEFLLEERGGARYLQKPFQDFELQQAADSLFEVRAA